MLARARALKMDGVDIVIGLVECHGRRETEVLLEGLEVLPRRKIEYRGRTLEEFDVDAALARRPKLIVVDELAHTNAPDSRPPSDGGMSRNCSTPASTSGRPSTSNTSRAWPMSSLASRASPYEKRRPIA
jgi:hypothetical protein